MPFTIQILVADNGTLQVNARASPLVVARFLREAAEVVQREITVAQVLQALENRGRIEVAPAGALRRLNGEGKVN